MPAVLLGAFLAYRQGASSIIWIQQVSVAIASTVACLVVAITAPAPAGRRTWIMAAGLVLAILAATLVFPGVEGVRRWIPVGPLQLNAAAVALPILLVAIGATSQSESSASGGIIRVFAALATLLLVAQPDASQATAFGIAGSVLLLSQDHRSAANWVTCAVIAGLAASSWTRPDPLLPVPYVEQIVELAAQSGRPWQAAAILSLALLPLPFAMEGVQERVHRKTAMALGLHFGLLCIVTGFGAYPVPVLGFGPSFVLGYYAALGWLLVSSLRALPESTHEAHARSPSL